MARLLERSLRDVEATHAGTARSAPLTRHRPSVKGQTSNVVATRSHHLNWPPVVVLIPQEERVRRIKQPDLDQEAFDDDERTVLAVQQAIAYADDPPEPGQDRRDWPPPA